MNFLLKNTMICILGYFSLSSITTQIHAGQTIYQFTDSNGSTILTNKKGKYSNLTVVKKTYYADSNIHSYSNWGRTESSVLPSYSKNKNAFDHHIRHAAQAHGVPEGLIKAVMHTESGFNTQARSPVGAQGLMQLMPATAKRFNVNNAYDPQQNIYAGAKYLAWLLKRFNGNLQLALAGYNAGEGNVAKYGGIPPFRETQDYVKRVLSRLNNLYSAGISKQLNESTPASSENYTQKSSLPSTAYSATQTMPVKYSNRPIIMSHDGSFTDAPITSTYSTSNATASARIIISDN